MEFTPIYTGIFDSHAHYDSERFEEDRHQLLESLPGLGVCGVLDVGCDFPSSQAAVELAARYPHVYASVGYHPHEADSYTEEDMEKLLKLFESPKVRAIGEIGLDYHYDFSPREVQRQVFIRQLELAAERNLPVIIHSREATAETLEILGRFPGLQGVVHCFSGSAETAAQLVKMGWHIGFTGVITFQNARRILEACPVVPADRILLETDCPYMTPVPFRRERCWSPFIGLTAQKMAEIRGEDPQALIDQARKNTCRLFGIPDPLA